ncbi:MAG: PEGA domain-containing protein [Limisphaerales bacterium]
MNAAPKTIAYTPLLAGSFPNYAVSFVHRAISMRAAVGLGALFLSVAGFLGYMYFQEWRLRRGFNKFGRQGLQPGAGGTSQAALAPRRTLIRQSVKAAANRPAAQNGNSPIWLTANEQSVSATNPRQGYFRGAVHVQGDDALSEIFVDGAFFGSAPATLRLPEGSHVVQVKREGVVQYTRELVVVADSELTLYPLPKTPPPHSTL